MVLWKRFSFVLTHKILPFRSLNSIVSFSLFFILMNKTTFIPLSSLYELLLSVFWLLIFKGSKKFYSMQSCCYCRDKKKTFGELGHFHDLTGIYSNSSHISLFKSSLFGEFKVWKLKSLMHYLWLSKWFQRNFCCNLNPILCWLSLRLNSLGIMSRFWYIYQLL